MKFVALLLCLLARIATAQERDADITGGWLFAATSDERVVNPGIVIRAGKFLRIGGDLSVAGADAERIRIDAADTIIPGLFDLHAHYAIELFNAGRKDETSGPTSSLCTAIRSTISS